MGKSSEICQRIKQVLLQKGMKQKDLYAKAGISSTLFWSWSNDEKNVTEESLQKVAQALGVTVEFLRGEPERLTPEQGELVVSLVETIDRLQAILTRSVRDPEYAKSVLKEVRERETKLQGFACLLRETLAQKTPPDSSA